MNALTPFDHDGPARVIQGDLIKCVDGRWVDRDGIAIPDIELIPFDAKRILQRWQNQVPIETIAQPPLPDVDELAALVTREILNDDIPSDLRD